MCWNLTMTKFLVTDENPDGYRLEDILSLIRNDMLTRATKIMDDPRPQAKRVLGNDIEILGKLADCIALAEDSSHTLDKSFGPHEDGKPRIGVA